MIEKITDKIVTAIVNQFTWSDKYCGIVKRAEKNIGGVTKAYPIAWNQNPTTCNESQFLEYVPNEKKLSIIYFEDLGQGATEEYRRYIKIEQNIRLVCWANLKRIDANMTDYQNLLLDVMAAMPKRIANFDSYNRITVRFAGVVRDGLFANYSYNAAEKQFMIYPYDYFGINLKVNYAVSNICSVGTDLNPSVCY